MHDKPNHLLIKITILCLWCCNTVGSTSWTAFSLKNILH